MAKIHKLSIREMASGLRRLGSTPTGTAIAMGSIAFLLYLRTLAPDVFVSDFAEFQYLPYRLGLAHPNGFPFYMLLGWVWSHVIPHGNVAWRMNLLSAVGGALAVGATAGFAHDLGRNRWVGVFSGGLVALTPTFWGYSLVAERYTLNLFLLVCSLWLVRRAGDPLEKQRSRLLVLAAFMLGLGFATHPSDTLLVPFWAAYALLKVKGLYRRPKLWVIMATAWALPLLFFIYVPWRWSHYSAYPLVPGIGRSEAVYRGLVHVWYTPGTSWQKVRDYVLGLRGAAFGFAEGGWRYALKNLKWLSPSWQNEIPIALAIVGFLGLARLVFYDVSLASLMVGFAVFLTLMVAYIRQGKNDAYLLPAFWVVLFSAGFSIDWLVALPKTKRLERVARYVSAFLVIASLLYIAASRYPARDMSRRSDIRRWWMETLDVPMEKDAALLGHWSDLTAFWYLQEIDDVRPGVLGLFPPDERDVIDPWVKAGRPLYLAAPTHGWARNLGRDYKLVPWGRLVRILPKDTRFELPFSDGRRYRTNGLSLAVVEYPRKILPETPRSIVVRWKAERDLPKDLFLGLRLEPPHGKYIGVNAPLVIAWLPGQVVRAGTEGFSIVPVRLPIGAPPGNYRATLGIFHLHGSYVKSFSDLVIPVGEVEVLPTKEFHRSLLSAGETSPLVKPRVGGLTLLAYKLSRQTVRPGDPVQIQFVWRVNRKLDKRMEVRIRFWGWSGGKLTPPVPLFQGVSPDDLVPGTVVRTVHVFRAPKGLGDRTFLVEARIYGNGKRIHWLPLDRMLLGVVYVKDRPHVWALKAQHEPVHAAFDHLADLEGYEAPESIEAGNDVRVRLYWHVTGETEKSYKVFVHLLDKRGRIVAQHDSPPANGRLPTDTWIKGEYVEDEHVFRIPPDLPPGAYMLTVGLYDPSTGARLPVSSELPSKGNALELTTIHVERR